MEKEKEKEKEKSNVNSPDTVLEDFLRSAESHTDSSKPSTSESQLHIDDDHDLNKQPYSKWVEFFQLWRFKSKRQLSTLHPLKLSKRFSSSMREDVSGVSNPLIDANLNYFKPQWKNFRFSELQAATSNFCQGYLIGKGGYAEVYRGRLRGGQLVAIKRLTKGSLEERIGDFLSELGIMAHVNHPNTAKLLGYGVEGGMYLVLELSPLGSLASLLHSSREKVEWDISYLAPEFLMHGIVDEKTDVFAFGVLLLELITGRRALDYSQQSLVMWAKPLLKKNRTRELVDPSLAENYNSTQMNLTILAASLCVQQSSIRLSIEQIIGGMQILLLLRGSCGSLDLIRKCKKLSSWKKYYKELFSAEKYSSSFNRGLNLQTHMVMEA
ncbi:hypothetical protein BUALT_Bualt02G0225700 [Buddleja alternifolia]|uniref:Protein kinase domain-containing protein n=1 Tax=Buddleja alternifolia TaxID=168488 RepID=A0AAV6Y9J0_9LAMI|nr:hypothetical protein BUALT_Bualt02G0225700 [Buddleja alternifolia]